ncbi:MAG: type II secretion system protein M [Candidatus Brocadiaceae bacterium]|nr:type II secretion system protein M [Candidatus Brocadiaceae bacterium]
MERLFEIFGKYNLREKILIVTASVVVLYFGVDRFAISPFFKSINETRELLDTQKKLLGKYHAFVAQKKHYEERVKDLEHYYAQLQDKFLFEETEELASAKLQEIVNTLAKKNGLSVSRSTSLKKEVINKAPYLIALSINFEIRDLDSIQKMQKFLYDIECNNEKLLFLNNLRIKTIGLNVIKGASMSSTLTAIAAIEKKL